MVLEGEVGNGIDFLAVSPKHGNPATVYCSQRRWHKAASISASHDDVIGEVEVRVGYVEPHIRMGRERAYARSNARDLDIMSPVYAPGRLERYRVGG